MFALTALLLTGAVQMEASVTLTYDFMANHPSSTIRMDNGYKEIRGSFAYWTGQWAGLFGNKIAFDATSAYPSLLETGGLCDFHDHQKMYVLNLTPGDRVTFYYSGTGAALQFYISSTARIAELTANFDPIASGTAYTVTGAGNLCVLNKWKRGEAETVINRIVIESIKEYEPVNVTNGMCTFCSTVPLDFSATPTLKAFIATGFEDGKLILGSSSCRKVVRHQRLLRLWDEAATTGRMPSRAISSRGHLGLSPGSSCLMDSRLICSGCQTARWASTGLQTSLLVLRIRHT